MTHKQHGVTIGGLRYVTNEHGKFVPVEPETAPVEAAEAPNGNKLPHGEATTDKDWEDA